MVHGREHAHAVDDECGWHARANPPVQVPEVAHLLRFEQGGCRQEAPTVQKDEVLLSIELCVKECSSSLPSELGWRRALRPALWRRVNWYRCRGGRR